MNPTDAQLRALLLRRLPSVEAAAVEDAIVLEDGVAERLRCEEFDLLDDHAAGRLSVEERADVERHLLSTAAGRESLRVARLLRAEHRRQRTPAVGQVVHGNRRPRRYAAAAALLAAGVAAVVVIPTWLQAPRQPTPSAEMPVPGAVDRLAPGATDQLPVVILRAAVERGAGVPALHWKAASSSLRLQVEVPDAARNTGYSLWIENDRGERLSTVSGLTVRTAGRHGFVEAVLPAAVLGPGVRGISLIAADAPQGAEPEYHWQVVGSPE